MGYVFLANAVHRIGKFLFPNDWDGSETYTPAPYRLWHVVGGTTWPIEPDEATMNQKLEVHGLLQKFRPEFKRDPDIKRGPFGPQMQAFTREEWRAGIEEAERINAENAPKLARKTEIRRFIKRAILDGRLTFVLRPKRGGAFSQPQDRSWWNVEDYDRIFYWCQMNPQDSTGIGVGGESFQYVFVGETELNAIAPSPELLSASAGEHSLPGSLHRAAPTLHTSAVPDEVSVNATENISEAPARDRGIVSQDGGLEFTATERDIHAAIKAIWQGGPTPSAKGQLQSAVDKYLKSTLQYTKTPDPRTYQRYFKKIGAAFLDK
ncbi:hypothetical protein [Rhizobium bangladeshense]|uniref:hypothetical protein n=1 Tax=Rhizobium bangladeshense TaxID=1138189 RepID=UPI001C833D34|nr:hypothetical protein [Rhizobium bangladeshense]MBX4898593.1 hypothetical protein [Rhizobium bangladeshense]MBY3616616.1 hypothetical protein [Rhizobium bangladeshense]